MKAMKIFMMFLAVFILAFFAIGYASSIQTPAENTTARAQYDNLTKVVDISNAGIQGILLMLLLGAVIAAAMFMLSATRGR